MVQELACCHSAIGELEQLDVERSINAVRGASSRVCDVEGTIKVLGDRIVGEIGQEDRSVASVAAIEGVVAGVALKRVVAPNAGKHVVVAIANEGVGEQAAPQVLHGTVGVTRRFARVQGGVGKIGNETDLGGPKLVVRRVATGAAIETVSAAAARKEVVRTIADKNVAEVAASDALDRGI